MPISPAWLSPEVIDQILALGREAAPHEACGIITPDLRVTSLQNVSPNDRRSSYAIQGEDLVEPIEEYANTAQVDKDGLRWDHFIIWHTHPGGHIGPSPRDYEGKFAGFQYAVIALPNGEATMF